MVVAPLGGAGALHLMAQVFFEEIHCGKSVVQIEKAKVRPDEYKEVWTYCTDIR